jgi:hypothetical protein
MLWCFCNNLQLIIKITWSLHVHVLRKTRKLINDNFTSLEWKWPLNTSKRIRWDKLWVTVDHVSEVITYLS